MSAGVAASLGGRATPEAVHIIKAMGLDISDHQTQPLTEPLVRHADVIFTMTRAHREADRGPMARRGRAGAYALCR